MGKSMVLKDLAGRISGYARVRGTDVLCRIQPDRPSRLAVVFVDGSHQEYALDGSGTEQCFSCEGKEISGSYVFREQELLLISEPDMRAAFEKRCFLSEKIVRSCRELEIKEEETETEQTTKKNGTECFAQHRRWPPPPCWNTAVYRDGCWQEGEC